MSGPRRGRLAALAASTALAAGVVARAGGRRSDGGSAGRVPGHDDPSDRPVPDHDVGGRRRPRRRRPPSWRPRPRSSETTTTRRQTPTTAEVVVTTTSTSLEVTTSNNVLVPGDGTAGAESTTTTTETPTTISNDDTSDGRWSPSSSAAWCSSPWPSAMLTWRYWVATRPPPAPTVGSDHG